MKWRYVDVCKCFESTSRIHLFKKYIYFYYAEIGQ
jgi:hypothetical protein